jgi:hypothetical protein
MADKSFESLDKINNSIKMSPNKSSSRENTLLKNHTPLTACETIPPHIKHSLNFNFNYSKQNEMFNNQSNCNSNESTQNNYSEDFYKNTEQMMSMIKEMIGNLQTCINEMLNNEMIIKQLNYILNSQPKDYNYFLFAQKVLAYKNFLQNKMSINNPEYPLH